MLISYFRNKLILQFILLFLLCIGLWTHNLVQPVTMPVSQNFAPFYNFIAGLLSDLPLLQVIIAGIFVFFQAIWLNEIFISNNLIQRNILLPALIYVVLMSSAPAISVLHPVLIANFIIIAVINQMLSIYNSKEPYLKVLQSAILISIASWIYFPFALFIVFLWLLFVVYQLYTWREWLISVIGFLLPYLYLAAYYFITDRLTEVANTIYLQFALLPRLNLPINEYVYIVWFFIAVLAALSIFRLFPGLFEGRLELRKKTRALLMFFLVALGSAVYSGGFFPYHLTLLAIPFSVFFANYFLSVKKTLFIEILFLVFLLYVLFGRWIVYLITL